MISTIAFGLLCLSILVQIVFLLRMVRPADPVSHYILLASGVLLLADTVIRSIKIRFPAITNTYESLVFFSAMICFVLFVYRVRAKQKSLPFLLFGGTVVAAVFMALASSPIAPDTVKPPIPALQSYWLVLHVAFAFIGEAFFAVSFVASILYLAAKEDARRDRLDRLIYTTITVGYPIFTAGALVFGAVWAEHAWGRYWSWDPKETWALITWLTYTVYLHVRFILKKRRKLAAVISIAGFAFTLFTFFGVNYLLPGLHSYA
jgi:ABC-type transport system involved in cytochrome c biogenesis permease subunit